ncbi:hypothetical protein RFI_17743 [Reticulomyxa filosa]|uniref:Uncharacterized protein n=1 Tax=Reticulomyxa filosa TaxID=46433 RepID=X6N0R5_RETFI|nr:hypothetical protein RFI_17743 [Reticulomyxa filosa]|eukprot:ETO19488.1 hypothetical protein RFI_17743 [Reticulomyxa filosa]
MSNSKNFSTNERNMLYLAPEDEHLIGEREFKAFCHGSDIRATTSPPPEEAVFDTEKFFQDHYASSFLPLADESVPAPASLPILPTGLCMFFLHNCFFFRNSNFFELVESAPAPLPIENVVNASLEIPASVALPCDLVKELRGKKDDDEVSAITDRMEKGLYIFFLVTPFSHPLFFHKKFLHSKKCFQQHPLFFHSKKHFTLFSIRNFQNSNIFLISLFTPKSASISSGSFPLHRARLSGKKRRPICIASDADDEIDDLPLTQNLKPRLSDAEMMEKRKILLQKPRPSINIVNPCPLLISNIDIANPLNLHFHHTKSFFSFPKHNTSTRSCFKIDIGFNFNGLSHTISADIAGVDVVPNKNNPIIPQIIEAAKKQIMNKPYVETADQEMQTDCSTIAAQFMIRIRSLGVDIFFDPTPPICQQLISSIIKKKTLVKKEEKDDDFFKKFEMISEEKQTEIITMTSDLCEDIIEVFKKDAVEYANKYFIDFFIKKPMNIDILNPSIKYKKTSWERFMENRVTTINYISKFYPR